MEWMLFYLNSLLGVRAGVHHCAHLGVVQNIRDAIRHEHQEAVLKSMSIIKLLSGVLMRLDTSVTRLCRRLNPVLFNMTALRLCAERGGIAWEYRWRNRCSLASQHAIPAPIALVRPYWARL